MRIAQEKFNIPQIISPHHMANPDVDELSMMTYLSYFTQDNGVGEKWTLDLVNGWNGQNHNVKNFNNDWSDGKAVGKGDYMTIFLWEYIYFFYYNGV